ncbi:Cancer susceptibility candidate protein 1-like protein [Heterocephalus glaber]|uniref:Dynein axonemal intermediate chain 7 n=1 Tax=Heterocephalus glaber TaxID=10181 RepID=G5BEH7_HETGA|nr:Cancer susceptibility candidate protein 1-like protein [Heterocephalus glaber]
MHHLASPWKHYIQCDGSPDPSVPQEMNTFISLWKEETNETFEIVIEKSKLVLQWKHYIQCDGSPDPSVPQEMNTFISLWKEETNETFEIVIEKSKLVLQQASTLADLDTGNMEKIIQDENVTLYVWANLKKNPRILATSDIALRLLHTHYDHVTPPQAAPAPSPQHTSAASELFKSETKSTTEAASQEAQEDSKPQERGSVFIQEGEIKVDEQVDSEVQMTSVKKESKATECELEMKLLSETVAAAQLNLIKNAPEKPEVSESKEVDLCQFTILGGVYHLDILELPPQCKPVKGWMMVEILKEGLQKFTYPPEITENFETENAFPPIEVTLQVQEKVAFFEEPMVARWDAKGKYWRTDGISDVYYTPEKKLISFNLETFGPVTLMQDTHINMPYQSWELQPLDVNKALLTVTTVFTEIQIQIKVPLVEMKAYRQMALLSSAIAFGWSKWNTLCDSTNVVFKVREHLTEEHTDIPNWALFMFSGDRARRLKINEESESFSEALGEETELHSTLYHMVKDFASKEAIEKVRSSSCQFIDSVCHMLLSTRVLSYS